MQINKLILRNIGAYHGDLNNFNFKTTTNHNVILIGGKNGAGKTTILESIRIALFGSMAYGYITENEAYFKKIRSLLNRKALHENNQNKYQIVLEYLSTEEFEPITYSLNRSWTIKDNKIREYFSVKKNNFHLNAQQISDFQNKLREEMPPRLFELCLFDGEDISRIVSEEKIPEYLQDAGKILFNLDLFVNLEKDLQNYRQQHAQKNSDASKELEIKNSLEVELHNLHDRLGNLQRELLNYQDEAAELTDLIRQDKKDFEIHGGLVQEKRQQLLHQVNEIEQRRKQNSDEIKAFTLSYLPFYIARETLAKVAEQIASEKNYDSFEYVKTTLKKNHLSHLLSNLLQSSNSNFSDQQVESFHKGLLDLLKPSKTEVFHRSSFEQQNEIYSMHKKIQSINAQHYIELFDENAVLLEKSQELRKAIDLNDNSSEFKELLERIEKRHRKLEQIKIISEKQLDEINEINEQIKLKEIDLNKLNDKIREYYKSETSYAMTEKLLTVSQRFRERQWQKKLNDVAKEATKMINILFRKKDYIDRIHIDSSSFQITLYNKQKQEITKERLSAGEKEMLMLTVIWAMFKVSEWKLPFVFDTLFGRLDQDHKKTLIEHFIPKCGDQVLMFTTDSEIGSDQFEKIKDITSFCYTLEYNSFQETAEIVQGRYFNMSKETSPK
ncbi:DNA sulfur modification protein DndD [Paenibacillus cellulositrophicus]|uniref:DNA sulfur modification protein DndD n=1 Tax=Paenibacillus cellulositrophicus TaxID=562959 RepID=UPI002041697C|nr:DNA sulfur modification protein DndD [Paenibacillus cellulositrophicus]MCM3001279.1 DNA sulfur modification protein DndD [Paenibacillus cellulositrophicus]